MRAKVPFVSETEAEVTSRLRRLGRPRRPRRLRLRLRLKLRLRLG